VWPLPFEAYLARAEAIAAGAVRARRCWRRSVTRLPGSPAAKALAALRADPDRFDLVLTDEIMPEMTGTQLAAEVHESRPELPVMLMTGYGGPIETRGLRAAGIRDVLRKPCRRPTWPKASIGIWFCTVAVTASNTSDFRCSPILAF
jgi:CheY-like chemotaxis protein